MAKICNRLIMQSEMAEGRHRWRLALEALGWRLWCEDGETHRDNTHYVFWMSPEGNTRPEWHTEGVYSTDPNHHWYPPILEPDVLLYSWDWDARTLRQGENRVWEYTVRTPWVNSSAVMLQPKVAALHALLGALHHEDAPEPYRLPVQHEQA